MSVLIEGMEVPKSCYVCPFCDYVSARCDAMKGNPYTQESRYKKRDDFCPLVPVPDPHGRLIDADAILKKCEFVCTDDDEDIRAVRYSIIENAPTVIPASEKDE